MEFAFTEEEVSVHDSFRGFLLSDAISKASSELSPPFDRRGWDEFVSNGWMDAIQSGDTGLSSPARLAMAMILGSVPIRLPWAETAGLVFPVMKECTTHWTESSFVTDNEQCLITSLPPRIGGLNLVGHGAESLEFDSSEPRLTANFELVPFANDADALLLPVADRENRTRFVLINLRDSAVSVQPRSTLDLSKSYADVRCDESPVVVAPQTDEEVRSLLRLVWNRYSLMLSAEAVGGSEQLLNRTIGYLTEREQFGVPIGTFQAMKHLVAEMAIQLENGRSLLLMAAVRAEGLDQFGGFDSLGTRLYTSRSYIRAAEQAIQGHGGFGFTWEGELHYWYRQALARNHWPSSGEDMRRILSSDM